MVKLIRNICFAIFAAFAGLQGVAQSAATEEPAFDLFSIKASFDGRALDPIEGVWHLSDQDEGVIAIVADPRHNSFDILVVNAADRAVVPGTLMGTATHTAAPGTYDARLFTHTDSEGKLSKSKNVILKVNEQGGLVFHTVKNSWKINFWKVLPYMFRYSISRENNRPSNIDGAYRIYPPSEISTLPTHL